MALRPMRCLAMSNASFQDHVEWALDGAPHLGKSTAADDVGDFRLPCLCAQSFSHLLVERGRYADHGGGVVVQPADRIHILLDLVARERPDEHPGPVALDDYAHVRGAAARVAH